MEIFIAWFFLSMLVALFAGIKGRSGITFGLIALILSPLIGFIAVLVVSPNKAVLEERELKYGSARRCPYCAELIKEEAKLCKHCGSKLIQTSERPIIRQTIDEIPFATRSEIVTASSPLEKPINGVVGTTRRCSHCNQDNLSGSRYCMSCGQPLHETQVVPSAMG